MKSSLFLLLVLSCAGARAGVVAPITISVPELTAKPALEAATIAKAIDIYNRVNSNPAILGNGRLSVHLWVSSQDGKSVEAKEIPALIAQGQSVVIKHDALLLGDNGASLLIRTPSKPVGSVEQLRQWAEEARASAAAGDFDGALNKASAEKK